MFRNNLMTLFFETKNEERCHIESLNFLKLLIRGSLDSCAYQYTVYLIFKNELRPILHICEYYSCLTRLFLQLNNSLLILKCSVHNAISSTSRIKTEFISRIDKVLNSKKSVLNWNSVYILPFYFRLLRYNNITTKV